MIGGVEVEQEMSEPPPKKHPGSAREDKHANALGKQYLRASCSKDKLASSADLLLAYHAILPQRTTGRNV